VRVMRVAFVGMVAGSMLVACTGSRASTQTSIQPPPPSPDTTFVPNLLGHSPQQAKEMLMAAGLAMEEKVTTGPAQDYVVTKQNPGPGTLVETGDSVTVFAGAG
jgi:beta-lactam-binding protein with PASTA domain